MGHHAWVHTHGVGARSWIATRKEQPLFRLTPSPFVTPLHGYVSTHSLATLCDTFAASYRNRRFWAFLLKMCNRREVAVKFEKSLSVTWSEKVYGLPLSLFLSLSLSLSLSFSLPPASTRTPNSPVIRSSCRILVCPFYRIVVVLNHRFSSRTMGSHTTTNFLI